MRKRMKALSAMLAAVMALGMMAPAAMADSTEAASSGGTLRWQINTLIDSMDSVLANDGTSFSVLTQVEEGLYTRDENGTPILGIASDVQVSDDGLTYTFTIRDDAKWSNGDPVKAQDFVFAWQRLADPDSAAAYQWFIQNACIVNADDVVSGAKDPSELGVEATDDSTLVVHLSVPCSILPSLLIYPCFFPIQQEFFESCGDSYATSADTMLYDGPFAISDYEPSAMTFSAVKNDAYYDADKVSLDGVQWQVIQDSQTAAMSYDSGSLDFVTLTGSQIDQYSDDPEFSTRTDGYEWYITPNFNDEALSNKNIRLALAKSFDKTAITTAILKDGSIPVDSFVPAGLAVDQSGKDFRETAGDSYDSWTCDVTAAQDYWAKGLEELGKDSLTLSLMCEDTDTVQQVAQFLQSQWQTNLPGLTIELTVEPKKARLADMSAGNYQLGLTRWGPDYGDPMTYLDLFESSATANYSQYKNDDYDAAIASCKTGELATDLDGRWAQLVECEKTLADDVVCFPVYDQSAATLMKSSVKGVIFYSIGANYYLKYVTIG